MVSRAFVPRSLEPEAGLGSRFFDRRRELLALCFGAGSAFIFLSLASFRLDPEDPGGGGGDWMGIVGANLARVLVLSIGGAAWLAPFHLALLGAQFFRKNETRDLGLRIAGDVILLLLTASLLQVLLPSERCFGGAPMGGNVGLVFGELLRGLFSTPGSVLVVTTASLLIGIGRASFSLVAAYEKLITLARALTAAVKARAARVVEAWRTASEFRREQEELLEPELGVPEEGEAERVFFQPDLVGPWIPSERTGRPPLAVVEALRRPTGPEPDIDFWSDVLDDEDAREARASREKSPESGPKVRGRSWEILDDAEPEGDSFDEEASEGDASDEDEEETDELEAEDDESEEASEEPKIVARKKDAEPTRRVARERKTPKFELPNPALLEEPPSSAARIDKSVFLTHAARLEATLADYGVLGKVEEIHPGPTVTTYEVAPSAGTKVSKVAGLSDDLALGLSRKVRIVAPIPGKSRIGFELPNDRREPVYLRDLIEDARFVELAKKAPLPVVLGRDIVGAPYYADLASMPHVIVAGATGAGKSVGLNVMLSSLLFMRTPEELRLLMIDPKVVELAPFDRIPHLLLPVVTDMKQAATALKWAVDEMERRYQLFADAGTKNIGTYNRYVERVIAGELTAKGTPPTATAVAPDGSVVDLPGASVGQDGVIPPERLPYIVIVVDEFADLMMQQGKEVEVSVARLAQKARAAGMHVILATQRPSVDVITGMIKANFPTRIAFRVAQKVDSRTILDEQGAEVLLGRGDMLVKMNGAPDTQRVQCPFISEEEVSALTDHLRAQAPPQYQDSILARSEETEDGEEEEKVDPRFEEAVLIVRESQRCSTSWLQRKMTIGYNRAAKMVEMMEKRGYVGPPSGSKDREVLIVP
jgi:S-DNA-T family DNA segregation ATPase FtsK/SpoIIIE